MKPSITHLLLVRPALCGLIVVLCIPLWRSPVAGQQGSITGPPLLTYKDLVALYENDVPSEDLDFRFNDGGAFDFRGSKQFSVGRSEETLSNSNERASKGFVSTLELKGKVTIEMKLDWIFVKPAELNDPDDTKQPYVMAPQFGRTLKTLNYSLKNRISDHNPLIVDLRL